MSMSESLHAQQQQEEENEPVEVLAQQFLSTANNYFQGELKLVSTDYDCLIQINTYSLDKYKQMHGTLQHVNNSMRSMNDKNCINMLSTHVQLNETEDAMTNLESTIIHLDAYSRLLEDQMKKIEKTFLITRTTITATKE